jgi:hypothetical protein
MSYYNNGVGVRTGRVIDSAISTVGEGIEDVGEYAVTGAQHTVSYSTKIYRYFEKLWNDHATKIVIVLLLLFLAIWYRQEVSQATSDVTDAVYGAVDYVGEQASGVVGQAGDLVGLSDTSPVDGAVLSPQVQPGELSVAGPATPAEIRALFSI